MGLDEIWKVYQERGWADAVRWDHPESALRAAVMRAERYGWAERVRSDRGHLSFRYPRQDAEGR
jgi:hypothetical protein